MAQHDMNIANQGFPAFRSDLNSALSAIISNSSGATEPSTTVAYQFWADTTNDLLKQRNAANDGWVSILTLSTGEPVTGGTPDKIEEGNSSVEVVDSGTGYVSIVIDGTETARFDSTGLSLPDNQKLLLGASDDLQIYHDGSHSYISDQGTGNLRVLADNLYLNNAANTQNYLSGVSGGATTLFHNGSSKLATTSTGVNVTGALTVNGGPLGSTPPTIQTFTSSGTWNKPSGCQTIKVTVTGGGGGGGSTKGIDTSNNLSAGGGGAGGTAIEFIDVTSVSSVSITVGSGGAGSTDGSSTGTSGGVSSFGAYCSASGGSGGYSATSDTFDRGNGGAGGTATGGDLNITGGTGTSGTSASNGVHGGDGAASYFGGGGRGGSRTGVGGLGTGISAYAYGGGGGGGSSIDSTSTASGGNGASGIVIVEEFY